MNVTIRNRQRLLKVDVPLLKKISREALCLAGATEDNLTVVLVDDKQIAELNERFHKMSGPTDILTFDYGPGTVTGELIVSVEHAVSQAKRFRTTPSRELVLYIIHGILHLHGHNDRTPRQRARMRVAERRHLRCLATGFSLDAVALRRS